MSHGIIGGYQQNLRHDEFVITVWRELTWAERPRAAGRSSVPPPAKLVVRAIYGFRVEQQNHSSIFNFQFHFSAFSLLKFSKISWYSTGSLDSYTSLNFLENQQIREIAYSWLRIHQTSLLHPTHELSFYANIETSPQSGLLHRLPTKQSPSQWADCGDRGDAESS